MVENGILIPFAPQEEIRNQWGEPECEAPQWGEPIPAAVEITSDNLLGKAQAGEVRKLSATALVEGEGPLMARCKAERLGEDLGQFQVRRRAFYPFVGRTRYELEQC